MSGGTTTRGAAPLVLVAGGVRDPNLDVIASALARAEIDHLDLRIGAATAPAITWSLADDRLTIDGVERRPSAAFVRHDVFEHLHDRREASAFRAGAWYTTLAGWLAAHPEVAWLNRAGMFRQTNKLHALGLARACGLEIPKTLATNELGALARRPGGPWVAKPVGGGGYCRRVDELVDATALRGGIAAAPAIVQPELVPPELRLYGVRGARTSPGARPIELFAFEVIADALDYREDPGARVERRTPPPELAAPFGRLMDALGLDFAAADFKAEPASGRLLFLEINNGPMFVAFDRAAGGELSAAIVCALAG